MPRGLTDPQRTELLDLIARNDWAGMIKFERSNDMSVATALRMLAEEVSNGRAKFLGLMSKNDVCLDEELRQRIATLCDRRISELDELVALMYARRIPISVVLDAWAWPNDEVSDGPLIHLISKLQAAIKLKIEANPDDVIWFVLIG